MAFNWGVAGSDAAEGAAGGAVLGAGGPGALVGGAAGGLYGGLTGKTLAQGAQQFGNWAAPGLFSNGAGGGKTPYQPGATPTGMQVNVAPAAQSSATNGIDQNNYGVMGRLAQQYQNQANGVGPSLAQMQLQQATDQNLRNSAALAASGRNPALASYQATQAQGAAGQQAAGQSAIARLQEQYQAQQGLANITGQMQGAYGQNAAMQQNNNQFNAGATNTMNQTQAQINQQQNDQYNQMMQQQQQQYNQYQNQRGLNQQQAGYGVLGGVENAAGAGLEKLASDERLKTDIKPGGNKVRGFLDRLRAHEYRYKDPNSTGAAPGTHVSPMAQELEKAGDVGRSMVEDTPSGKMVNYGRGFATMLAAQSDLHQRVKALEGGKGGKSNKGSK